MTITQYRREITPVYERTNHNRRRIAGYEATLIDADGTVIHCLDYPTHHEAEVALDQRVYDLLNDQPVAECKRNVLGTYWTICGASGDGPCMCDVVIAATDKPDLATDLYNVICLTLSGAAATTAISELKRVQKRYEKEPKQQIVGYIITDNQLHIHFTPKNGFHFSCDEGAYLFMTKKAADEHCAVLGGYVKALYG